MSAQLGINGFIIELNEEITYNFQVSDVSDLSLSKSNYTSSFKIPRTKDNTNFFEGLGLPTDRSEYPYRINNCECLDDYAIVYTGTLVILKTEDVYYNATVISGVFDLATALGDKSFAELPFTQNLQLKTPVNVIGKISDDNIDQAYIIANYGGITNVIKNDITYLNVDSMTPAYRLRYLLDRIFEYANFKYDLTLPQPNEDNSFFTFPYPNILDSGKNGERYLIGVLNYTPVAAQENQTIENYKFWALKQSNLNYFFIEPDLFSWRCVTAGEYLVIFPDCVIVQSTREANYQNTQPALIRVLVNNLEIGSFLSDTQTTEAEKYRTVYDFQVGDILEYEIVRNPNIPFSTAVRCTIQMVHMEVRDIDLSDDVLSKVFAFKMIDFIKEVMYRFMLIGIQENERVRFISLYDILNNQSSTDWSDKFVRRIEESYDIGYSQNNWLRHSYDLEDQDYRDLNVTSNNQNLSVTRDMLKSSIFTPSENKTPIYLGGNVYLPYDSYLFKTFDSKDDKQETLPRNYWIESIIDSRTVLLTSQYLSDTRSYAGDVHLGDYNAGFNQSNLWPSLNLILDYTKKHIIELDLNIVDIINLDMSKPFYFQQESALYLLNKLQFKKGTLSRGEFIKINR